MILTNRIRIVGFLFFISFASNAQHKYEKEHRIKSEMIPESAKAFIDSIGSNSKVKWYQESNLKDITIEAKFNYNNKKYSVEFDTLGILQDVEIEIKETEINPESANKIEQKLDSLYQKWKFQKIQITYKGRNTDIYKLIKKNILTDAIIVYYEIVLKGKTFENTELYEITFDEFGEIVDILRIIQDKADHLEY